MNETEQAKVGSWLKDQSDCPVCGSKGALWESRGSTCRGCTAPLANARSISVELAKIWLGRRRGRKVKWPLTEPEEEG